MIKLRCYDIEWDTDDCEGEPDLPNSVIVKLPDDYDPGYDTAEALTDKVGFCVKAFCVEYLGYVPN